MVSLKQQHPDQSQYRVWPDGVADSMDEHLPTWKSDDFMVVWALDVDDAARAAEEGFDVV